MQRGFLTRSRSGKEISRKADSIDFENKRCKEEDGNLRENHQSYAFLPFKKLEKGYMASVIPGNGLMYGVSASQVLGM